MQFEGLVVFFRNDLIFLNDRLAAFDLADVFGDRDRVAREFAFPLGFFEIKTTAFQIA